MPYDCFISYASEDFSIAEEVYRHLSREGFTLWFDKARLRPGFDWHREIEQGCENSRVLLPVLTPNWKKSDWTKFETYGAEAVIPLLFEGDWKDVLTPPLERFQAERLDLTAPEAPDWSRLITSVSRTLNLPFTAKVARLAQLRYRANDYFVGRERDLIRIHEEIHSHPQSALTEGRVRVIAALGGVGKTTLARHYVEKFWRCYPQLFWVDCRLGLETEFAHVHDTLFPERANIGLNDSDKASSAFRELNGRGTRLLILDNAEDEKSVMDWVPKTGGCHTLITSRFTGWSAALKQIQLDVLDKDAAVKFLQARTSLQVAGRELEACQVLAGRMGYLPLALEQAAAYVEQQGQGFGFADYLRLYEDAARELLAAGALGSTEYPDSVIATWKSTIAKLSPIARAILRLSSFFASTPIPIKMMFDGAATIFGRAVKIGGTMIEKEPTNKEIWTREELACLKVYSLVKFNSNGFFFHTLLQTVERLNISDGSREECLSDAIAIFRKALPAATWKEDRRRDWTTTTDELWKLYLPHGQALLKFKGETDSALLANVGCAYAAVGEAEAALSLYITSYQHLKDLFGADHSESVEVYENVGYLYRQTERYSESLSVFEEIYQTRARLLGLKNELTLRALHNLAIAQRYLGDFDSALGKMQEVAEARKHMLGEAHYDTTTSLHDQGWLLLEKGDFESAVPLFRHAMKAWEKDFGLDHPDTLTAMINLATALKYNGDYQEAESLYRGTIEISNRVFGQDHRFTLTSVSRLAGLLSVMGDYAQAEPFYRRLVETRERTLGTEHIAVWYDRRNYSMGLARLGRLDEAIDLIQKVIAAYRKQLEPQHRDLIAAIQDYGVYLAWKGENEEAEAALRESLAGYAEILGEENQDTLRAIGNLAEVLARMGRDDEARDLRRRLIGAKLRTAETTPLELREAALKCYKLGDYADAERLLRRVLEHEFEVSGTYCHLARILLLTDREQEARGEIAKAWEWREDAPPYVIPRILFFQILFGLLDNSDINPLLCDLNTAFGEDGAHSEWLIERILDQFASRMSADHNSLLRAISATIDDKKNGEKLKILPIWQAAAQNRL